MILVTGATGRVGYHLMEALADAGADATAMVRVEARAADLPGTPDYIEASFDDPPIAEILQRFDRVFLLSPAIEEQAVFAREVDYESQPARAARKQLLDSGLEPWEADGVLENFDWIRHGGGKEVTTAVRDLTGADPRPLEDWLEGQRGVFLGQAPGTPAC